MTTQQALIPQLIHLRENKMWLNMLALLSGILLLALLARISIPLPFTPVPITGQTFGVALVALLWGRRRAFAIVASYLILGTVGLPFFAHGSTGFFGATAGYLFGMLIASYVVGTLADHGWTQSYLKSWLAATIGSLITFAFGLFILSFYVPHQALFISGLIPFLPGDILKNSLAAMIAYRSRKQKKSRS